MPSTSPYLSRVTFEVRAKDGGFVITFEATEEKVAHAMALAEAERQTTPVSVTRLEHWVAEATDCETREARAE